MKTVICGFPQAGQTELFSLLTGTSVDSIIQKPLEIHQGICEVKDPRITKLSQMYKPKKTTYIRIEYALLPDFNLQGQTKATIFNQLRNADEICWITRDESGISEFLSELIINDLMFIEKRLETIAKDQKKKFSDVREKEKQLIDRCKKQLDEEKLLQFLDFSEEELKTIRTCQFFTMKPIVLVLNISEDKIKQISISKEIENKYKLPCIQLCAELEAEIKNLKTEDQAAFMEEIGIDESALDKMTQITFKTLGLISFFTVGQDEVRAWPIRSGSTAAQAGSAIHTDIEKGFVKAEMIKYDDLIELGSEEKVKLEGKFYLKGREYIVEDSDILNFRFNV